VKEPPQPEEQDTAEPEPAAEAADAIETPAETVEPTKVLHPTTTQKLHPGSAETDKWSCVAAANGGPQRGMNTHRACRHTPADPRNPGGGCRALKHRQLDRPVPRLVFSDAA
jgi:hypothetical protein